MRQRKKKKVGLQIARSSLTVLLALGTVWPAAAQQSGVTQSPPVKTQDSQLPDSPGVTIAKLQQSDPPQKASGQPPTASTANPSQPQPAPQSSTPKPEGTAAAGANPASGVAASQPAGMAIAPAKQRRTRTIVLRTGAILGAGVALGSVFALTQGTSSKPPGAH
jgi:hypothetical protein